MKLKRLSFAILLGFMLLGCTGCDLIIDSIFNDYSTKVYKMHIWDVQKKSWHPNEGYTIPKEYSYPNTKLSYKLKLFFKERYLKDEDGYGYSTSDYAKISLSSSDESIVSASWSDGSSSSYKTIYCSKASTGESAETGFYISLKKAGKATISIKADNVELFTIGVNVNPPKAITFKEKAVTLLKGESKQLEFTNTTGISPSNFYWSSSASALVSVDNTGKITANKDYKGTYKKATITVRSRNSVYAEYSDVCEVSVIDPSTAWTCKITNKIDSNTKLHVDDTYDFDCSVNTGDYSSDVTWSIVQGSDYATIDAKTGVLKAIAPGIVTVKVQTNLYSGLYDSCVIEIDPKVIPANQFFWGTWIRMDNGKSYSVEEDYVLINNVKNRISSSSETELVVDNIGTFVKDTDNVIKLKTNGIDIPFFRKGGTNLKYKLRVVGFQDEIAQINQSLRAAGTETSPSGKKGLKVKSKSDKYSSYTDEEITDDNGDVELTAPVQGDTETITISDGDEILTVVPGLKIENDGDNLGTIPVVRKDEYSLKITGTIDEAAKTNGYLYGNNREYPLTLTITNISNIPSETAVVSISSDSRVGLRLVNDNDGNTLNAITISTMDGGATKTIQLMVKYGYLATEYADVDINVRVTNLKTNRVWDDYVPLRFFAGDMPITITAGSTEGNSAALNGFLIYPDGNSKFFTVANKTKSTLWVPVFGADKKYKIVFSGATVTGQLSNSTEMFYTVKIDSTESKAIDRSNLTLIQEAYGFGEHQSEYVEENNNSENRAFPVTSEFQAYLDKGDIDFYSFTATSNSTEVHQ